MALVVGLEKLPSYPTMFAQGGEVTSRIKTRNSACACLGVFHPLKLAHVYSFVIS